MVPIPKVAGVLSCGFLLCLGLSNAAQAAPVDDLRENKADQKRMAVRETSGHSIQGYVLRVEGNTYLVKGKDGKTVRFYTDPTTSVTGQPIDPGDLIEARVNEQDHALSIFTAQ